MWLAAMNETLSVFFILLTLMCWFRGRRAHAALAFTAALFSKESAVMLIVLLPLVETNRGKQVAWRDYWILALPGDDVFRLLHADLVGELSDHAWNICGEFASTACAVQESAQARLAVGLPDACCWCSCRRDLA
jgi:hypothetical protein